MRDQITPTSRVGSDTASKWKMSFFSQRCTGEANVTPAHMPTLTSTHTSTHAPTPTSTPTSTHTSTSTLTSTHTFTSTSTWERVAEGLCCEKPDVIGPHLCGADFAPVFFPSGPFFSTKMTFLYHCEQKIGSPCLPGVTVHSEHLKSLSRLSKALSPPGNPSPRLFALQGAAAQARFTRAASRV